MWQEPAKESSDSSCSVFVRLLAFTWLIIWCKWFSISWKKRNTINWTHLENFPLSFLWLQCYINRLIMIILLLVLFTNNNDIIIYIHSSPCFHLFILKLFHLEIIFTSYVGSLPHCVHFRFSDIPRGSAPRKPCYETSSCSRYRWTAGPSPSLHSHPCTLVYTNIYVESVTRSWRQHQILNL